MRGHRSTRRPTASGSTPSSSSSPASLTAEELTDSCREHIAGYKLPRTTEVVDALPVSGAGKILERELRARHWDGARSVN